MPTSEYYLLTGATSGIGLEVAAWLAQSRPNSFIVVGARRPDLANTLRQRVPADRLLILELDTASLDSVKVFAGSVRAFLAGRKCAGLALNAGIQIVSGDRYSVDGFELTFATNVLGHIALFEHLRSEMGQSATVISTASGTHDPAHKLARPYKFFGGRFPSVSDVAAGKVSDSNDEAQKGRDRYATSKLCNIMFSYAMARHYPAGELRFVAFDPGLMPGTELARDQPAAMRFAWKNVLPTAAKLIDGASTPQRSGAMLAQLLIGERLPLKTGLHVEFTGNEIPSSELSHDQTKQDELVNWARGLAIATR
ncbi:SDR family NAD(P)-dependent oxidoreductase [Novosphingobium sp.]|uniref:SDR family NAD(P)-dependent oxidoreductase n=1 Tax=Novosphingobium sp. TaxID=1874826 RepID=UPI00286B185B|nr:SDR family NAD(P)-dependent oxidoreductase [Novosphingobium sp.]